MARKAQNPVKNTPDYTTAVDFAPIFDKVFGSRENPTTPEERAEAIHALPLNDQIALTAYLGRRIQEFSDICSLVIQDIESRPETDFPNDDCLISIVDQTTSEVVGGVSVKTQVSVVRSTSKKKVRDAVIDNLTAAGILSDYTRQTTEIQNDKLFEAKANGSLPQSVASLLTETEEKKRVASFQKLAAPQEEE